MTLLTAPAPLAQDKSTLLAPMVPRPHQDEAAADLDIAIWASPNSHALHVAPVAAGKSLILTMVAYRALRRGYKRVVVVSRAGHIATHCLSTLAGYALHLGVPITGGVYTGHKKQSAQIVFATVQSLARHLHVVEDADLVLIDEADQAYVRDNTKEYRAVIAAARRYGGVTGTPFVLEKGCTVPIFGKGTIFDPPCGIITKAALRDLGYFHFIEPAPVAPTHCLTINRKTKLDPSGDYDTRAQSTSQIMLMTIAADTKTVMDQRADQQFLFFGSTTTQCDKQAESYRGAGLRVAAFHNKMSASQQDDVMARYRAGELQGLCTVSKINRGFDLPAVSLIVIGFATTSRSKFEQMCGRAQRVFPGKTDALVLDYGSHGQRFGSANWDYAEAIEFDRREKLRIPAMELADAIRAGRRDPKCETRPDNFLNLFEETLDLFDVVLAPTRDRRGIHLTYVHSLGFTNQWIHPDNGYAARMLCAWGTPRFQGQWADPPDNCEELTRDIAAASLPSHIMLRRVFNTHWKKIIIAVVGYVRDGKEYVFDDNPVISQEWLRQRARDRIAGYDHRPEGPGYRTSGEVQF